MIKRRYFRQDHGDNSASSSSSSSGSDSDRDPAEEEVADEEVEEEQEEEEEEDEEEAAEEESGEEQEEELEQQVEDEGTGYQSEESSGHDVDGPSADDDEMYEQYIDLPVKKASSGNADCAKGAANKDATVEIDFTNYILKCKSVYKCKLCPRIMCLSEGMVRVHLESKRHARSKKLLGEGRLKLMLNNDGELEEEEETHAERHARTVALAQQVQKPKRDSGRQRQNLRKKRSRNHLQKKEQTRNSDKKGTRLKNENSDKKGTELNNTRADKKRRKTEN